MKVTIEFSMENAAFEDEEDELERVLLSCAAKIREQQSRKDGCVCTAPETADKLLDINGNTVGFVKVE